MSKESDKRLLAKKAMLDSEESLFDDDITEGMEENHELEMLGKIASTQKPPNLFSLLVIHPGVPDLKIGTVLWVDPYQKTEVQAAAKVTDDTLLKDLSDDQTYSSLSQFAASHAKWYLQNKDYRRVDRKTGHSRGKATPNGWEKVGLRFGVDGSLTMHEYLVKHWHEMGIPLDDLFDKDKINSALRELGRGDIAERYTAKKSTKRDDDSKTMKDGG